MRKSSPTKLLELCYLGNCCLPKTERVLQRRKLQLDEVDEEVSCSGIRI
jgi:hypothetical protein